MGRKQRRRKRRDKARKNRGLSATHHQSTSSLDDAGQDLETRSRSWWRRLLGPWKIFGVLATLTGVAGGPPLFRYYFPDTELIVAPERFTYSPIDGDRFRTPLVVTNPVDEEQRDLALEIRVTPPFENNYDFLVIPEVIDRTIAKGQVQLAERSVTTRKSFAKESVVTLCLNSIYPEERVRFAILARPGREGLTRTATVRQIDRADAVTPCMMPRVAPPPRMTADRDEMDWKGLRSKIAATDFARSPKGTLAFALVGNGWYDRLTFGVDLLPPINKDGFWLQMYRDTDGALYCELRTPFFDGGIMKVSDVAAFVRADSKVTVFVLRWNETGAALHINQDQIAALGVLDDNDQ